ncbi:hypothetical protein ABKN59_007637 [Abortiporus biennis]
MYASCIVLQRTNLHKLMIMQMHRVGSLGQSHDPTCFIHALSPHVRTPFQLQPVSSNTLNGSAVSLSGAARPHVEQSGLSHVTF